MPEENFESRSHITKHLTGAKFDKTEERTRINSWEEQDYLNWKKFLAKTLGVSFYEQGVEIYMSMKISKDGLSREEDVELGKGMYDEERTMKRGGAKVRYALRQQQKDLDESD